MKFETFKLTMELLKDEYDDIRKKDKKFQEIFGKDSCIISDVKFIDKSLKILEKEFDDKNEFIDWFFYEVLINNDLSKKISINSIDYEPTYENIYKIITNKI